MNSSNDIKQIDLENILRSAINLEGLSEEEQQLILEEAGELVWRNALFRFMSEQSEEVGEAFTALVEHLTDTDTALDIVEKEFPEFSNILQDELSKLHDDMKQVVDALEL